MSTKEKHLCDTQLNFIKVTGLEKYCALNSAEINYDIPEFITNIKQEIFDHEVSTFENTIKIKEECILTSEEQCSETAPQLNQIKTESIKEEDVTGHWDMTETKVDSKSGQNDGIVDTDMTGNNESIKFEEIFIKNEEADGSVDIDEEKRKKETSLDIPHHNKSPKARVIHKCTQCDYQSRRTTDVKKHTFRHNTVKEADMLKCTDCAYRTLNSSNLKQHALRHKTTEEVKMFNCDSCDYQSKWKHKLRNHLRRHDPNSIYKCEECAFQTERKDRMNHHIRSHSREVKFKCDICYYRTIHKRNFKRHIFKIHNLTEFN